MKQFTNRFQISKTLRFELIPTPKTKEIILQRNKKKSLLDSDKERADYFFKAKQVIDRFHRTFIDKVLKNIGKDEKFQKYLLSHESKEEKTQWRGLISHAFTSDAEYSVLFGKTLLAPTSKLYSYAKNKIERDALITFQKFTIFLADYHQNRKNMYVAEAQNTAIAYRIVDVNLPKFEENNQTFVAISETPLVNNLSGNRQIKKLLKGQELREVFMIANFPNVLTQTGIDLYNEIAGLVNEQIKLYNDQLPKKEQGIALMRRLHKQILGYKEDDADWRFKGFCDDKELLEAVILLYNKYKQEIAHPLKTIIENLHDYDLSRIYIRPSSLTNISQYLYGDGQYIMQQLIPKKNGETDEDYVVRLKKSKKRFSIQDINSEMRSLDLCEYFAKHTFKDSEHPNEEKDIFDAINKSYNNAEELLNYTKNHQSQGLAGNDNEHKLKKLLDSLKVLQHFVQPLRGKGDERNKDWRFYGAFDELWEKLYELTPLYEKVHNYMTKKPFSKDKIKIIFDIKRKLLDGWVDSQTASDNGTQYGGYLFRKKNGIGEYDYYLGVSSHSTLFRCKKGASGAYERLDYYQVKSNGFYRYHYKGANSYTDDKKLLMDSIVSFVSKSKDVPTLLNIIKNANTPKDMLCKLQQASMVVYNQLLNDKSFQTINRVVTRNLKESLISLKFPKVAEYREKTFNLFSEVQDEIERICREERNFSYFPIDDEEIRSAQEDTDKPFLLFKISNKDLSYAEKKCAGKRTTRGRENLHTMYFKALMEGGYKTFDLGTGEIYFRESSIPAKVTHPAGVPINNKNELVRHERPYRTLDYNLIKDKRYTEDKYLFYLSIVINYQQPELPNKEGAIRDYIKQYNLFTLEYLRQHKGEVNIIGIDRGERNLIYATVINSHGEVLPGCKPRSYNLIENFDYLEKLKSMAVDRAEAQKNWSIMGRITDTKKGYLSLVVHEIAKLAVENHAIIVMEGLGRDFERMHTKIEYKVYNAFEDMLIEKLGYLAFKNNNVSSLYGNITKGLQMAVPFTNIKGLRQNGWLFYIPPAYTSKIDPETGFAPIINMKEAKKDIRKFFHAFNSIRFEDSLLHFIFNYNSEDIYCVATSPKREWHLASHGSRVDGKGKEVDLTKEFCQFFSKVGLGLEEVSKEVICDLNDEFLSEFFSIFCMMLQMRNSSKERDYIISPVAGEHPFETNEKNTQGIKDADANGAYNIALKGLYWLYKNFPLDEKGNLLYISNEEWFRFLQTKPYLNE